MAKKSEPEVTDLSNDEFELMFGKVSASDDPASAVAEDSAADTDTSTEADKEAADAEAADAEAAAKAAEEEKAAEEAKASAKAEEEAAAKKAAEEAKAAAKAEEEASAKKAAEEAKAAANKAAEEREARSQLSDDEKALIAETEKDFPDVAKVIEIQKRILSAENEKRMEAFKADLIKQLQPMAATVNTVADDAFERAIKEKHSDAYDILPNVEAWIETQPAFLRAGYNRVLDNGTVAETIELFNVYKEATGAQKSEADLEAERKAAEAAEQEKKAKEENLQSMEGVRGRQAPKPETEPTTFEDGFERASRVV